MTSLASQGLSSIPPVRTMDVPLTKETVEDRPWTSVVVESQTKQGTAGVFGVGLKVNINGKFDVMAVTGLRDRTDRNINASVNVGDILCFVNDRSVHKEGSAIIETTIFGELGSLLKLSLKNIKTGAMYDLMVKRHVPIRPYTFKQQWYSVKEEYSGKELLTDARIVKSLDAIRHCAIDEQGREVDFLAGIKKRGSHCGLHLAPEKTAGGRKINKVVDGSPASFMGLKAGDVVTSVDGETGHGSIGELLGSEQRIGSVCKVGVTRTGGKREQMELVRTQVASMNRCREMLEFIEGLSEEQATPECKAAIKSVVVALEKERQYEERVMAGRLNASNTTLLDEVWKAAETLIPPRPEIPDLSDELEKLKRANAELTRSLQLANSRNEELAAEMNRLQQQNAGMVPSVELDHIREELESLKRQLAGMVPREQYEKMEKSLQGIAAQLRDEKKALEDKLKDALGENAALRAENDDLKRRLKLLEQENAALKTDNAALAKQKGEMVDKDQYAKMEESLQGIIAQLRADKKALEGELKAAEKSNAALQAENAELRRKLKAMEEENAGLRGDIGALKQQLREAQEGKDGAAADIESLKRKLKAAEEDADALKKQLQAAEVAKAGLQADKDVLQRKVKSLEDENAELRAQLEALKKELAEAKAEADRLAAEADALKRKVAGLETQIAALEAEKEQLKAQLEGARKELAAARKEADRLKAEKEALERKVAGLESKVAALEGEKADLIKQVGSLKGELEAARKEVGRLKAEKEALERKVAGLESKVAALEGEKADLIKQVGSLKGKLAEAEAEADKWRKIAEPLQAAAKGNQSEVEAANAKVKELRAENDKLKEELAKLQLKLKQSEGEVASLKSDMAALKDELKRAKEQTAEAWKALEASQKEARDLAGKVAKLEAEKETLGKELAAAREQIAKQKADLEASAKELRKSEDANIKLKSEIEQLKSELQAARDRIASLESQLQGEKEQNAKLTKELKETHARATKLQEALDAANKQLAELKEEIRKFKLQVADLERKLKNAEAEAARLQKSVDDLNSQLATAKAKMASLEEQLDAEKKARAAAEQQLKAAQQELAKAKADLDTARKTLAEKGGVQDKLEALLRELALVNLDDAKFRKTFIDAIASEPMLQPAGVLRLIQAAKALTTAKLDTVSAVLETMNHPSVLPDDVLELLKLLRDGKPARTAIEAQRIVKVMNQEEPWSAETLLQMREALKKEGVTRPEQVIICPDKNEHAQVEYLKQRIRELLSPDFDQKGCTFVHRTPLTIRGRPGSTIYACIQDESVRPTKERYDKCCPTPMDLVIEDSCVVTAISTMQGALEGGDDLSAPKVEAFTRKRVVTREAAEGLARAVPILPEERVGVGMLIEKDADEHADIIVKTIAPGGEVDKDGRIAVGDVLLEVDGQDLDGVDLHNVWELIMGPPATEVVLVLERKGAQRAGEGVVADNLYSVKLFRTKNEVAPTTFSPQSFVDSGKKLLDSGRNLLDGVSHVAGVVAGPRATSQQSPALSQAQFSTIRPNASMLGQSPITISSSPGASVNRGPGVNSPGIYHMSPVPGQAPPADGTSNVLIAM